MSYRTTSICGGEEAMQAHSVLGYEPKSAKRWNTASLLQDQQQSVRKFKCRTRIAPPAFQVSSTADVENMETENHHHHHHHHHAKAPAPHAPAYAPIYAPKKAPVHAPAKAPIHHPKKAPIHAPIHAPKPAPAHAPAKSPVHSPLPKAPASAPVPPPHGCVAQCTSYCKPISPKRPCMKTCTACCAKCKCVPGFTKCNSWNSVEIRGHLVKCP